MKKKLFILNIISALFIIFALYLFISPEIAEARGGRSFGGSRSFGRSGRSFGGNRSYSTPKRQQPSTSQPRQSFGGTKQQRNITSFGGSRISKSEATAKYGVPRKTETFAGKNSQGMPQNYMVHSYGGYGSGLMTGYMMGTTSWLWMMPFHPAFYYSRPNYVYNQDGSVEVYPPTFSWSRLFFTLIIFAAVVYIIYIIIRNLRRKRASYSSSSFS
jgi:hypothetical protein